MKYKYLNKFITGSLATIVAGGSMIAFYSAKDNINHLDKTIQNITQVSQIKDTDPVIGHKLDYYEEHFEDGISRTETTTSKVKILNIKLGKVPNDIPLTFDGTIKLQGYFETGNVETAG